MPDSRSLAWSVGKLGEFATVRARIGWRGLSSSEYTDEGPFLIAGQHIRFGEVSWDSCDHISDRRYDESWEISLKNGDVILTKDGTVGRVARIDDLPGRATINGTMMLIRCHQELDYRYLSHYLKGDTFQHLVEDRISGSSIPHLFQRDMVQLELPVPSLTEQRRIADVLDAADEAIKSGERLAAKLKQVKKGLLEDLLTCGIDESGQLRLPYREMPFLYTHSPSGPIPKSWTSVQLRSCLIRSPTNGIYKPTSLIGRGALMVGQTAFTKDRRINYHLARRGEVTHNEILRYGLTSGDILVSRVFATLEGVGQPALVTSPPEPAVYESNMVRLRIDRMKADPKFIFYCLQAASTREHIQRNAKLSNQASVSQSAINSIPLGLPSREEQLRICASLDTLDARVRREKEALAAHRLLRDGLGSDLLTGRVRVGDAA